jgi:hypothetical protein
MRVWSDRGSNLRSTAHVGLIRQGLESTIYRTWGEECWWNNANQPANCSDVKYCLNTDSHPLFCREIWVKKACSHILSTFRPPSKIKVEETGIPGENHRPVASHRQTLSHTVVWVHYARAGFEPTPLLVICTDCIGSCIFN